jgi:hypothetical protein
MVRPVPPDDVDIIEELQLRRWARENYVGSDFRTAAQHPVIRDEMRAKDAEIIIESRARDSVVAFVPLAPTVIQRLHEPHDLPEQPALLRQPQTNDAAQWLC